MWVVSLFGVLLAAASSFFTYQSAQKQRYKFIRSDLVSAHLNPIQGLVRYRVAKDTCVAYSRGSYQATLCSTVSTGENVTQLFAANQTVQISALQTETLVTSQPREVGSSPETLSFHSFVGKDCTDISTVTCFVADEELFLLFSNALVQYPVSSYAVEVQVYHYSFNGTLLNQMGAILGMLLCTVLMSYCFVRRVSVGSGLEVFVDQVSVKSKFNCDFEFHNAPDDFVENTASRLNTQFR